MVQTERATSAVETPAETSTPVRSRPLRVGAAVVAVALVAGAGLLVRLGAQQRNGPPHTDVTIPGGIPATIYVPGDVDRDFQELPDPAPVGERPPVVVLGHGFSADRDTMSAMARSFTAAGYAVVAIDFRGHGSNTNSFHGGDLRSDLDAVVDWVGTQPHWDAERLIVAGHSMGAGAVLDFATVDPRPKVVVPISGGWNSTGTQVPDNVLFILAEGDPSGIHDETAENRRRLAAAGAQVSRTVVPSTDHATILWSGVAVERMVAWMDGALGIERTNPATRVDGRLGTSGLYFLCALVLLAAIGTGVGRLAPAMTARAAAPAGPGVAVLAGALLVTMPLLAMGAPAAFIPFEVIDNQASHLFATGALVLGYGLWRRHRGAPQPAWLGPEDTTLRSELRGLALPAALAMVAIYLLLSPFGAVFHRLTLSPARLLGGVLIAVTVLPFFLAVERLTRRGSTRIAVLLGLAGKAIFLIVTLIGLRLELLPGVIGVIVPILVLIFVMTEVFAAGVYAAGRNITLIAVVHAAWFAWVAAAAMPIRL
jgi:dienelactone hydrolase